MSKCPNSDSDEEVFESSSPRILTSTRLFVEIPRCQDHKRDDGTKFTTYEVVVRCNGKKWTLHKRYSEFSQLRHSLLEQHKIVQEFDFPHKSKFNTFSNWTKERRRTGFEDFMMLLLGFSDRLPEVDQFLDIERNLSDDANMKFSDDSLTGLSLLSSSNSNSPISNSTSASSSFRSEHSSTRSKKSKASTSHSTVSTGGKKCIPKFPPLKSDPKISPSNSKDPDGLNLPLQIRAGKIKNQKDLKDKVAASLLLAGFIGAVAYSVWWISGVVGVVSLTCGLIFRSFSGRKTELS